MRMKEEAHDYRYFPDPDLVPLTVDLEWLDEIRESLPELPDTKRDRFVSEYSLPEYDADILIAEKATAELFEEAVKQGGKPKNISNLIMTGVFKYLNEEGKDIDETPIKTVHLAKL